MACCIRINQHVNGLIDRDQDETVSMMMVASDDVVMVKMMMVGGDDDDDDDDGFVSGACDDQSSQLHVPSMVAVILLKTWP